MLMRGGGATCMVETGYLYPAPNSVFDLHYSIRTEGHYFAARDNQTLEILDNDRQARGALDAADQFVLLSDLRHATRCAASRTARSRSPISPTWRRRWTWWRPPTPPRALTPQALARASPPDSADGNLRAYEDLQDRRSENSDRRTDRQSDDKRPGHIDHEPGGDRRERAADVAAEILDAGNRGAIGLRRNCGDQRPFPGDAKRQEEHRERDEHDRLCRLLAVVASDGEQPRQSAGR